MEIERRGSVESNSTTPKENQTVSSTVKQTNKQTNKQTSKQTNKQTNKQASKQTNKQTNKKQWGACMHDSYSCLFDRLLAGRPQCGCTDIRDSSSECFTSLLGSYLGQNHVVSPSNSGKAIDCA